MGAGALLALSSARSRFRPTACWQINDPQSLVLLSRRPLYDLDEKTVNSCEALISPTDTYLQIACDRDTIRRRKAHGVHVFPGWC